MKKVIIIEDSPTFSNMLGKKVEAKGWKTILCYNYRDGLKAVKESSEWDSFCYEWKWQAPAFYEKTGGGRYS